jgi:hypothetical protein
MSKTFKYNKLKKHILDNTEEIILVRDVFNPNTGERKETETYIDSKVLDKRITALADEIDEIKALRQKINDEDFDEIIDKKSKEI